MLTKNITLGLISLVISLGTPAAMAAKFKIDGGFVTLENDPAIRLNQESGRYLDLGRGYYRTAEIGCKSIKNTSAKGRSGLLSLEYWALPTIDSETGSPLMSVLLPAIKAGKSITNVRKEAFAKYYNAPGYIQLRLYEYSGGSWLLRVKKSIGDRQEL